jgi:hypothetical protein
MTLAKWSICAAAICVAVFSTMPAHAQQKCREYTKEIRTGQPDVKGTLCLQPDGTWRPSDNAEVKGNGIISFGGGSSSIEHRGDTRIYTTHPDAATQLVIEDNVPAYIVVDPYRWHGNYSRRDWSPEKRSFYRHHNGPGWNKHWKHHKKVLKKD